MRPGPQAAPIELTERQRAALELLKQDDKAQIRRRAEIVLVCAQGLSDTDVAVEVGTSRGTVGKWRRAFTQGGLAALSDAPRTGRRKAKLVLSDDERQELERYVRRGTVSQQLATRARLVLACAQGLNNKEVAGQVGVNPSTVARWRGRFIKERLQGLMDEPRPGAPRQVGDELIEELLVRTLETTPRGATHWSTRSMAKASGVSASTVGRVWRAFGLKPHLSETFQLSTDPHFIEKVRDVVGLYMNPPDNAMVLCVDEKSQIQALNRTQPILPFRRGQLERYTPEYERNGTTTLFAALDVATGSVLGKCYQRHRAVEFRKFLNEIRAVVPEDLNIHIILDNYATHSAGVIQAWLSKNPRFHLHFIPTHSSWLNEVETWFSILTAKQIKRGSHTSVNQLKAAIHEFLDVWNEDPKPFKWTKTADQIFDNLARYCYRTLHDHEDSDDCEETSPVDS